ncbi:ATG5 (YPL149W) [Zygosaccharomyces parabailii]|uniref:Autophagy protein 5 n=1 Tax=Zygosaccharomyces bailii (strain CLIB 213 / ATCC 58445 / CBS 680 / BCRC 21525 / NBRC 1098 / NCYC 1416 / NRRL Y-2227) TaxID=1333698 RepID=A0A8J2T9W1_ZYGB2|nr:ATG5 (YPL149W) [Zygosaccharomyces parabailii]CDF91043.1 ZYBA0S09-03532g1_1 [Zygosaccharomyces bailii CLIB 213]CDH14067.1 related to Autophagy protein 5 [Zygosaccharomyces bailii ISA1307]
MDQIRSLVWNGALNLQVSVKESLLLKDVSHEESVLNIRVPRDTYFAIYLPTIFEHLRPYLLTDPQNDNSTFWFQFENVPLFWNYPVGVLYDSMLALNPSIRACKDTENSINMWKIELNCGPKPPAGIIPLIDGIDQIRSYWMHQWKQSCYILNGSAKQLMSLPMQDSQQFWESVLTRDRGIYESMVAKIVPKRPKSIPIVLHQTLPAMKRIQPLATEREDDGTSRSLQDLLKVQYPGLFPDGQVLMKAVSNGIEIPLDSNLFELYQQLRSFDGFLHVCICLVFTEEYS